MDYFLARYYSSAQGRFTSADPAIEVISLVSPARWNKYTYVANNPLGSVDLNGRWPTSIHDRIIRLALPGLTREQVRVVQEASFGVDFPKTIMEKHANEHAMRRTDQTLSEAVAGWRAFIDENATAAQVYQRDYETLGGAGFDGEALYYYGIASHPVADNTSPAHAPFQIYYGPSKMTGNIGLDLAMLWVWQQELKRHSAEEANISDQQLRTAVYALRELFATTFGSGRFERAVPAVFQGAWFEFRGNEVILRKDDLGVVDVSANGLQTYRGPLKPRR